MGRLFRKRLLGLVLAVPFATGCAAYRGADFLMPALRFDRPTNRALPSRDNPRVSAALSQWHSLDAEGRARYPTPYHVYVDVPAPGTFEGGHVIGLAFSGGGTRGMVFAAMCIEELDALGPIIVETDAGFRIISLLDEVDYVCGVSTGAIPAAAFALNYSDSCPAPLRFENWPECFNTNLVARSLKHLAKRPDRLVRDFTFDINTRPALCGAIAASFFEGATHRTASGLTFASLPEVPVVFLGAAVVADPGAALVQTRMPYRYAIDAQSEIPWGVGVQSFESFRTDPMAYSLGEACYNSLSHPGSMRSGRLAVRRDPEWIYDGLPPGVRSRMERARNQYDYTGVYDVKDGGLIDNRGIYAIDRLFAAVAEAEGWSTRPLLIALDAGYSDLRLPEPGTGLLSKGWFRENYAASRAAWQAGQDAHDRLFQAHAADIYTLVHFRFSSWIRFMAGSEGTGSAEHRCLVQLCADEPCVGTPEALLEILRGIGTTLTCLDDDQLAATRIAARFAVWRRKDDLLKWASAVNGGAPARFGPSSEQDSP